MPFRLAVVVSSHPINFIISIIIIIIIIIITQWKNT